MKATVTAKGQITLPSKLRRQLGLKQGSILEFEAHEGELRAHKVEPSRSAQMAIGCLADDKDSISDYLDTVRGPIELPPSNQ